MRDRATRSNPTAPLRRLWHARSVSLPYLISRGAPPPLADALAASTARAYSEQDVTTGPHPRSLTHSRRQPLARIQNRTSPRGPTPARWRTRGVNRSRVFRTGRHHGAPPPLADALAASTARAYSEQDVTTGPHPAR